MAEFLPLIYFVSHIEIIFIKMRRGKAVLDLDSQSLVCGLGHTRSPGRMLVPQGTAPTPRFAVLGPSRGLRYRGRPLRPLPAERVLVKPRTVPMAVAKK